MINTYYFIDENSKVGCKINLQSHNISYSNSMLSIIPTYPGFEIETRYNNKILKEMVTFYARKINQNKNKYPRLFSASFHKINDEDQRSDEMELLFQPNNNHNITKGDIDNIDAKSQSEHQFQIQETKESGWIVDKFISVTIRLYKTFELIVSSYVKITLTSSASLNNKIDDKYSVLFGQY